ncbi:MAG: hypothetical protein HZB38_13570 [Planctomycetes bacterium]|nr:hypothetical protein [Planctomycetota bacterium]
MSVRIRLAAAALASSLAAIASADIHPLSPTATYLRTNNDQPTPALTISLANRSLNPGDWITITALGDFNVGSAYADQYVSMIGVFSSSPTLLANSELTRVPGAIEAGPDYVTTPTWNGNLPTDIPEDFAIGLNDLQRSITIEIPGGASWLVVGILDSHFGDNTDPDGDLAVGINAVPEPASISVLALGLAWLRRRG